MAKTKRKLMVFVAICGLGTAFQYVPNTCGSYLTYTTLSAIDFCAIVNCTGGAFFNFCDPAVVFVDCP